MSQLEPLVRELSRPEAHPRLAGGVSGPIEVRETHISLIFLVGERAYKVKKPVDLGFLDFTTLERRRFFCEEEVRLNRRLAPDVYLGVVPVTRASDGHLCLGGPGEVVDWAVEMVRLPEHRMFARLLERGEIDNELMNALALLMADFHAGAPSGPGVDEHGSPAAIARAVDQNFEQIAPFVAAPGRAPTSGLCALSSEQHVHLRTRARGFLATQRALLERRIANGRIREGHGDLHSENICILDGRPIVYDCIEFSRALRCLDVANDLAFLAMDLDRRGVPAFARYLVRRYAERSRDPELTDLVDFYKGYRAVVRGKVAALTAGALGAQDARREELRREALSYFQLAVGYELPPALVMLCGLPGSGKSFLAPHLARPLRAVLLHSDVRRKALANLEALPGGRAQYGSGSYTPEQRRRTYRALLEDASAALTSRRSVIVDATFSRSEFRAPFVDAAVRLGLPWCIAHITASEEQVRERLAHPRSRGASEADLAVYLRAREEFEPPDEVPGGHVLEIRSGAGPPEEASALVVDRLIHVLGCA